jgi:hypothetical protein
MWDFTGCCHFWLHGSCERARKFPPDASLSRKPNTALKTRKDNAKNPPTPNSDPLYLFLLRSLLFNPTSTPLSISGIISSPTHSILASAKSRSNARCHVASSSARCQVGLPCGIPRRRAPASGGPKPDRNRLASGPSGGSRQFVPGRGSTTTRDSGAAAATTGAGATAAAIRGQF